MELRRMNRIHLVSLVAVLLATPMVTAHDPAGTPKNYCEPQAEWLVHDYGAPASGGLVLGNEDGNLAGDCDPGFTPPQPYVDVDPADPLASDAGYTGFNPPAADWDGHGEYALGGAWLLVETGNGEPSADPAVGAGTAWCFGAEGHHPSFGPFGVEDVILGSGVSFSVASDTQDLTGTGEGCGDFENDESADGVGYLDSVTFPPGLDGAYVVHVQGTAGHVQAKAGPDPPTPQSVFPATITISWAPAMGSAASISAPGIDCDPPTSNDVTGVGLVEVLCRPPDLDPDWLCANPFVEANLILAPGVYVPDTPLKSRNDCTGIITACDPPMAVGLNVCAGTVAPNWGIQGPFTTMVCRVEISDLNQQHHVGWEVTCHNDP
jgi:hypothetical protein